MLRGRQARGAVVAGLLLSWLGLIALEIITGGTSWVFSWAVELGVAVAILLAAWTVGWRLLARIWPAGREPACARFVEIGLGLGSLSLVLFAIGATGWLSRWSIAAALLAGTFVGVTDLIPAIRAWVETGSQRRERWLWAEALVVVLPLAWGFLYAAMPPVFYDAVVYHLGLPNLHLASGSLEYPSSFSLAGYPQNAELILVVALAAGNETAARITNFLICALAALALRALVRERIGRVAGNLTYLLLVSQWFFWFQAVFLKVDVVGAFFLLTAFWAILSSRENDGVRPWIVGGLLAGIGVGVKFANLVPVALATISSLWLFRPVRGALLRRAAVLGLLALAVGSPWMVRNAVYRGNPFFPAFYELLGGDGWEPDNAARMRAETGMNVERTPVAAVLRLARIGWQGGYGSGGETSRVWVALLLAGLMCSRDRGLQWLLACAAINLAVGLALFTSYLRVYAFALMVIAIGSGVLWDRLRPRAIRWALGFVSAVVIAHSFLFSARMCDLVSARGWRVVTGRMGPQEYAEEQLGYLPLARYINENLAPSARLRMIGSARSAYIHRPCIADYTWDDQWIARLVHAQADPAQMAAELRAEGFTHVVLDPLEMDRLERANGLFGYADSDEARERIDRFFRRLPVEAEANGIYLFRLPEG